MRGAHCGALFSREDCTDDVARWCTRRCVARDTAALNLRIDTVCEFTRLRIQTSDVRICRQLKHSFCERLLRTFARPWADSLTFVYSIGIVDEKIRQDSPFESVEKFTSKWLPRVGDPAASARAALTRDQRNDRFITFSICLYWAFDFARKGCAGSALHHHMERTACRRLPWQRLLVGNALDQWSGAAQHLCNGCAQIHHYVLRSRWIGNHQQNPDSGVNHADTNTHTDAYAGTRANAAANARANSCPCTCPCTCSCTGTCARTCARTCSCACSCACSCTGTGARTGARARAGLCL